MLYNVRVLKVGGTCLASGEKIDRVLDIIEPHHGPQILVVSAINNTTKMIERTLSGSVQHRLLKFHQDIINYFINDEKEKQNLLEDVKIVIGEIYNRINTDAYILTRGEYLSAIIMNGILRAKRISSGVIKAGKVIKTESISTNAHIDERMTRKQFEKEVVDRLKPGKVIIIPGFTGSDSKGNTTCLGENSSDLTAAILAKMVKDFANIASLDFIKDTKGWQGADQRMVKNPKNIPLITVEEASKVLGWGQPILHPESLRGVLEKGIRVRIIGILDNAKTTITKGSRNDISKNPIVAIAGRNVSFLEIRNEYEPEKGYSERIDRIIRRYDGSISYEGGDPNSIIRSFVIKIKENGKKKNSEIRNRKINHINQEIKEIADSVDLSEEAEVHIIGKGIYNNPAIIVRAIIRLEKSGIKHRHCQTGHASISFIVHKSRRKAAIQALHQEFFEK